MENGGIILLDYCEWINGKTGLIEGSSLKNYKKKGKTSILCANKLYANLKQKAKEEDFKYQAVKERIKEQFGIWTDTFKVKDLQIM